MSPCPNVLASDAPTPSEEPGPPHAERPDAAPLPPSPRRRLRRAARLSAVVVVLAAAGAGCKYDVFGKTPQAADGLAQVASAPAPTAAAPVVAALPAGTPPLEHWYAVAQCETGGNWASPGPTYVGGLGMYAANWAAYGGLAYAPSADLATPEQQIAVATNLWLAGGTWGCRIGDGWDHV